MNVVCGFSDLAAGLGGLAWDLGAPGGLVMSEDGVQEARPEFSEAEESLELRLSSDAGETTVLLAPRPGRLALEGPDGAEPPAGGLEAAICAAEVRPAGQRRTLRCFGHLSSWPHDPSAGTGTFRHLAIERSDGSLLLAIARGEDAEGHGAERSAAWLLDREGGFMSFGEALLSTQYDGDGAHTRAGLELWPEEEAPPMRAAGVRLGGTDGDGGLSAALLRCSSEGSEGLGSYVIRRG
jgi:hypothetical protein